jgi:hypothetical protein
LFFTLPTSTRKCIALKFPVNERKNFTKQFWSFFHNH